MVVVEVEVWVVVVVARNLQPVMVLKELDLSTPVHLTQQHTWAAGPEYAQHLWRELVV